MNNANAVGQAIQFGLMGLGGYFDSDQYFAARKPAADWVLNKVEETGDVYYPFRVTGINLNCQPGSYGYEFSWRVPTVCHRMDLTNATYHAKH